MSPPTSRLQSIANHLFHTTPSPSEPLPYIHTLSPTFFLPRAAEIEPDATAIYHVTANNKILRRTYIDFADRARGLAYFLIKNGLKRVGILAPNTPAFLESIFGVPAAGAVIVPVNYRLKTEDISYILTFSEVSLYMLYFTLEDFWGFQ